MSSSEKILMDAYTYMTSFTVTLIRWNELAAPKSLFTLNVLANRAEKAQLNPKPKNQGDAIQAMLHPWILAISSSIPNG